MTMNIGITGQHGFIGQHLYNTLGLSSGEFTRIEFDRSIFNNEARLVEFVSQCDVIVHLAALNRHESQQVVYDTNIDLVRKLINALDISGSSPHVLFASSLQEEQDNIYGKSKKDGRDLLIKWADRRGALFTGLVIPNVFGPFGLPYYNSFIATFCHQLTHNEQPQIATDGLVKLIYVGQLVNDIIGKIRTGIREDFIYIPHIDERKVSEILSILERFKSQYLEKGMIPNLNYEFDLNLFNTFRSYVDIAHHYPVNYLEHSDSRGTFVEIIHLNSGGQVSFSTTAPGITRGNHYHTRKIERFSVIKGRALIQLRRIGSDTVTDFYLEGDNPSYVDMPIWYTHNIKNIGNDELYTIFWINEFFDPNDPDTYTEVV